jgi:hypothetical protein
VENPAAEAPTYSEDEFNRENSELLEGKQVLKSGLGIRLDVTENSDGEPSYEVAIVDKTKTPAKVQAFQQAVRTEVERIDAFLIKYQGTFRIRFKDGDLKALTLTDTTLKQMANLRKAWLKALKKVENKTF